MARSPASAESLVEKIRPYIGDERVLAAVAAVPRHLFVPDALSRFAWENTALPIGAGQTISQPVVVARMCEVLELKGDEKVLDVGTGSGYHAAVLAHLAREVWSIERKPKLAEQARHNLAAAGIENVHVVVGDGSRGLPEQAPFDAINVAAAAHEVPAGAGGAAGRRRPAGRTDRRAQPARCWSSAGKATRSSARTWSRCGSCRSSATGTSQRRACGDVRRRASPASVQNPAASQVRVRASPPPLRDSVRLSRRCRRPGRRPGPLVELGGALALHLRALGAFLGLGRLPTCPRGLLLGACLLPLRARRVQTRVAAVAVRLFATVLGAPHAGALRRKRHESKHHHGRNDQQYHELRYPSCSFPRFALETVPALA